jgi:putative heme iron utilization protein
MADTQRSASAAEACRAIAAGARVGTLATLGSGAVEPPGEAGFSLEGWPYASLVLVAWDERSRPLLFLSRLAEHTKNLEAHPRASLLVGEPVVAGTDPLTAGRMTILGTCAPVPESEEADARAAFVRAHPSAAAYAGFRDFRMYRIDPVKTRYVAGFGQMGWI